jgi:aspartyl-tRNA(Asn)/glutamyl-tRNA(Gln) amidotransferase subunit B
MTQSVTAPSTSAGSARYEAVIGVEVHCQLRTVSKMFCACSTAYDGAPPNTHVCPVCLGLPGALPVINRRAVEHVLATGLAIEAQTPEATRWDRKNYFYPDLPKGYQISQYDLPLASAGRLTIESADGPVTIGITRAHLEEDTAKLVHATTDDGRKVSLIDFNRSGAPLMEIVTDPDIRTAEGARRYAEELQLLLRTIGASDADMERGQMRVEANISIRPRGSSTLGTRIEVKNMNSFRSVEHAIAFEIDRQSAALDAGEELRQETRGWSDDKAATYHMRSKETSDDYRYFPEPDLPPLHVDRAWLDEIRAGLPELPATRRRRLEADGLKRSVAATVVGSIDLWTAYEATRQTAPDIPVDTLGNLVTQTYAHGSNTVLDRGANGFVGRSTPEDLAAIVRLLTAGELSGTNAKQVLEENIATGRAVGDIVETRGFRQISDAGAVGVAVDDVLAANPGAVADYRAGKVQAVGFLVGQVMKATRGQANAAVVQQAVRERLEARDP